MGEMIRSVHMIAAQLSVKMRWMIRRNMEQVLEIEQKSFRRPWKQEDLYRYNKDYICMTVESDEPAERIVGYYVYHPKNLHIVNLAVHPDFRRQGIGRQIIERVCSKCSEKRPCVTIAAQKTVLPALPDIASLCSNLRTRIEENITSLETLTEEKSDILCNGITKDILQFRESAERAKAEAAKRTETPKGLAAFAKAVGFTKVKRKGEPLYQRRLLTTP